MNYCFLNKRDTHRSLGGGGGAVLTEKNIYVYINVWNDNKVD